MTKPYRLVVFDWEGTLGEDTLGLVLNALTVEAERLNYGAVDQKIAQQYVSLGLARAINKLFPELSLHQYDQLLHSVQDSLAKSDIRLVLGAKHIVQLLHEAGYELAIATNKGQQSLQRALQISELDVYFNVTRSAGQLPAKPCPQMLEEIMQVYDRSPEETLMIGDSISDIEMAVSINVDALGVDFYHVNASELSSAGALDVFHSFKDIEHFLQLSEGDVR